VTPTISKTRQQAEDAFSKVQSQFFAKGQAVEEHDFEAKAREAKTARLREARLAKELDEVARATSALIRKRAKQA
jgi:hypothetical protein